MNRKVRNLLASVVLGVCLLALSFIPSFAANSANSASVGNVEAMKECDLANKDIRNGFSRLRVKDMIRCTYV